MKLTYKATGVEVAVGDKITLDSVVNTITDVVAPHNPNSTGRVYLRAPGVHSRDRGYFPSVIGAHWVDGAAA